VLGDGGREEGERVRTYCTDPKHLTRRQSHTHISVGRECLGHILHTDPDIQGSRVGGEFRIVLYCTGSKIQGGKSQIFGVGGGGGMCMGYSTNLKLQEGRV
jgi:hypothetical protein